MRILSDPGALFDLTPDLVRMPTVAAPVIDREALDGYALLYTGTEKGNCTGPRFALTVEDAMRWCSSDASRGQLHGTRWAYFWTRISTYMSCHWGPKSATLDLTGAVDSGEWDERIAAAGCTKVNLAELPDLLRPFGVEVVGP